MTPILPGSMIGILGGGQLGRMLILAGRCLGYRFVVYDPGSSSAAGPVADKTIQADYLDFTALRAFADAVDVITLEFEGIPLEAVTFLQQHAVVRPSADVLSICQNRKQEKTFLQANGIPCVPFAVIQSEQELAAAVKELGTPSVLKTACWGYDGKGQIKLADADADGARAWRQLDVREAILEQWVQYKMECSAIVARRPNGATEVFPVAENHHEHHILDTSLVPARLPEKVVKEAHAIATELAHKLAVVGLLAVEFFVTADDELLVNEMAPRPHNSGHYSIDACTVSQFEQCIRAICDMPLQPAQLLKPVAMVNLLGDFWQGKAQPDWPTLLEIPAVKLHLYDKGEARKGRKMAHVNVLGDSVEGVLRAVQRIKHLEDSG